MTTLMLAPLPLRLAARRADAVAADKQQGVMRREALRDERQELGGAVSRDIPSRGIDEALNLLSWSVGNALKERLWARGRVSSMQQLPQHLGGCGL